MKLQFLGAARTVTGSCFLLETRNERMLVDCGMFQGPRELVDQNWESFSFDPATIDYVFLTHAHLDHCGLLPKLVRGGFSGEIISTDATRDLAEIVLYDAEKIQRYDYEDGRLRYQDGSLKKPIYRKVDVEKTMQLFRTYPYTKSIHLSDSLEFRMRNSGHILGSSIFELWVTENGTQKKFVFSGDLGQPGKRIIWDPDNVREADYIVCESTYGNREHKDKNESVLEMLSIFKHAVHDNANIIIPAFAIERSQEIIYEINLMVENGLLEEVPVFLDSPMAKRATEVFIKYEKYYDTDARRLLEKGDDPFDFVGFEMTRNVEDSKALASKQGVIIMAGSGMCTGGRVLHHLRNNLSDPRNHVMFVGYQVGGTLGRRLVEGDDKVRIFGKEVKVKAQVHTVGGLSAHADQRDLKYWLRGFGNTPEKVFIVHGDESVMYEFEDVLNEDLGLETHIPKRREVVELE